eukprot:GFUD01120962.1.p1 GENE.GFUD01120962.1~~GFUD01120962.1.p1  ORF type:complete len:140 (+),score=28.58 GFUD01120962.1:37-420(+)
MAVTTQSQLLIFCLVTVGISSLALPQADTTTTTTEIPGAVFDVEEVMDKIRNIQTEMDIFKKDYEMKILVIWAVFGSLVMYNVFSFIKHFYDTYLSVLCCSGDSKSRKSKRKRKSRSKSRSSRSSRS